MSLTRERSSAKSKRAMMVATSSGWRSLEAPRSPSTTLNSDLVSMYSSASLLGYLFSRGFRLDLNTTPLRVAHANNIPHQDGIALLHRLRWRDVTTRETLSQIAENAGSCMHNRVRRSTSLLISNPQILPLTTARSIRADGRGIGNSWRMAVSPASACCFTSQ